MCCVSENFWQRKSLWIRRVDWDHLIFPSNFFFLPVPKQFVEEPFSAVLQKGSGSENFYG